MELCLITVKEPPNEILGILCSVLVITILYSNNSLAYVQI